MCLIVGRLAHDHLQIKNMSNRRRQRAANRLASRIIKCIEHTDRQIVEHFVQGKRLIKQGRSSTGIPIRDLPVMSQ